MHFFPLGRLIRAASCTKAFDAAQAASRVLVILKCQVQVGLAGRELFSFTSRSLRIVTVLSLFEAASHRFSCSSV